MARKRRSTTGFSRQALRKKRREQRLKRLGIREDGGYRSTGLGNDVYYDIRKISNFKWEKRVQEYLIHWGVRGYKPQYILAKDITCHSVLYFWLNIADILTQVPGEDATRTEKKIYQDAKTIAKKKEQLENDGHELDFGDKPLLILDSLGKLLKDPTAQQRKIFLKPYRYLKRNARKIKAAEEAKQRELEAEELRRKMQDIDTEGEEEEEEMEAEEDQVEAPEPQANEEFQAEEPVYDDFQMEEPVGAEEELEAPEDPNPEAEVPVEERVQADRPVFDGAPEAVLPESAEPRAEQSQAGEVVEPQARDIKAEQDEEELQSEVVQVDGAQVRDNVRYVEYNGDRQIKEDILD